MVSSRFCIAEKSTFNSAIRKLKDAMSRSRLLMRIVNSSRQVSTRSSRSLSRVKLARGKSSISRSSDMALGGGGDLLADGAVEILPHQAADGTRRKTIVADFAGDLADGGHFGGRAGQKDLVSLGELRRHDRPLDHLDAAFASEADHRLAGYPVEKAVGCGGVQLPVDDQEDVGAGALGEPAAPVEHQRV